MSLRVFVVAAGFDATFRAEFLKIRCYGSVPLGIPRLRLEVRGASSGGGFTLTVPRSATDAALQHSVYRLCHRVFRTLNPKPYTEIPFPGATG